VTLSEPEKLVPEQGPRPVYASNGWEVDLARRELRSRGILIPLGSRAFEIIEVFVQAGGELVSKYDLMARVWPGAIVEENTLQFHISAIRKALGADRRLLKTVSRKGYRLLGTWTIRHGNRPADVVDLGLVPRPDHSFRTNVPVAASALIDRIVEGRQLLDVLSAYRVVTLTGPGGIGKSVLALDVARNLFPAFGGDCWLVEFVSLSDPGLVPSAVAFAVGLRVGSNEISAEAFARTIGAQKLLLVLDNCEHLVDAVARLAETVVRMCPRTSILATSREILGVDGEYVYRVLPLDVPPEHQETLDNVLGHSATQLFIARTRALNSNFSPDAESSQEIATICRRLDGIPLAIEFAAARAATLGVPEVAARLDDRFALLTSGRRTALPRHQTLRATLDWSYELLSQSERSLLHRLSIFPAGFTLQSAAAVMSDGDGVEFRIEDGISDLVSKSLVTLDASAHTTRWRLLETTRVYAYEKLVVSGEAQRSSRLIAEFFRDLLASASFGTESKPIFEQIGPFVREVDNVRATLSWAFGAGVDAALGCCLTAAAMDLWLAASLLTDCCAWGRKAVKQIGELEGSRIEMMLQTGLGLALLFTEAMSTAARDALTRGLSLAQALDDVEYQRRALHGLWLFFGRALQFRVQLAIGRQFEQLARNATDPAAQANADWLIGTSQLALGEHLEAGERLHRAAEQYPLAMRYRDIMHFGIDVPASARCYLAGHLLLRGSLDTAVKVGERAIELAREIDHPTFLCFALAFPTSTLFLKLGDCEMTMRYVSELIDQAEQHSFGPERQIGICAQGSLAARRGDSATGIRLLRTGVGGMREMEYHLFLPFFLAELAEVLAFAGQIDEAYGEVEAALQLAIETESLWFVPEAIRIKGEILSRGACNDRAAVEALFRQSIEQARRQQALYWELRAATSLSEHWMAEDRTSEARELLAPIYGRFTEGFMTLDLRRARSLLEQLP